MSRDLQLEDWLKDNGYTFKFVPDFPIAEIDLRGAREGKVRLDKDFSEKIAEGYGLQMIDHGGTKKFPGVVLLDVVGHALKDVLGGTHRLVGAVAVEFTTFDAYLLREPDPARIDFVHAILNSIEGQGETFEGRIAQMAKLRAEHPTGMKLGFLATKFGISRSTASEYMAADKAEQRADKLGVGTFFKSPKMAVKTKAAFEALQSDATFIAATQLIQAHPDLRGGAGVSLLKELKMIGSEVKAKALVADRDKELTRAEGARKTKKIRTSKTKATNFLSRINGVVRWWPGAVEKLFLAGLETEAATQRSLTSVEASIDIHMEIREELKRLIEEYRKAREFEETTPARHGDMVSGHTSPTR